MPCYRAVRVGLECRTGEQPPCARAVLRRMTEMRSCATRTQYPRACCTRRPTTGRYRSPGASAFDRPLNQASPSLSLSLPLHFAHPHIHLFCSFFSVVIFFFSVSLYSPSSPSSPSPPPLPPPFPPPPHPPYPPPLPPPSSAHAHANARAHTRTTARTHNRTRTTAHTHAHGKMKGKGEHTKGKERNPTHAPPLPDLQQVKGTPGFEPGTC
jgi:hypothetical protein